MVVIVGLVLIPFEFLVISYVPTLPIRERVRPINIFLIKQSSPHEQTVE